MRNIFQIIVAATLLGGFLVAGAWTNAPSNPPSNNVAAPINVGSDAQTKTGVIDVRGLLVRNKIAVANGSSYVLPNNLVHGVNGPIGASQYCDEKGLNCVKLLGGFGSTTGADNSAGGIFSRAAAIRNSGYSLSVPTGIIDWPNSIVCEGSGGASGKAHVLELFSTDDTTVSYWEQDGVGIWFNQADGSVYTAQRVHPTCGEDNGNIVSLCQKGRCM